MRAWAGGLGASSAEVWQRDASATGLSMTPRPGGEADKVGNRYEGAWTVRHVLYCLAGRGSAITVEDVGDLAVGAEFTYRRTDAAVEVHQLKRQRGSANDWTVAALQAVGVWKNAALHVAAGREFHFVSLLPSATLQALCDRARTSRDLRSFVDDWLTNKPLRDAFTELSSPAIYGSQDSAWRNLRGIWIEWHDERDIVQVNAVLAQFLFEGAAGDLAALGLGDLVMHNLGVELDAESIWDRLGTYGLSRRPTEGFPAPVVARLRTITDEWLATVRHALLEPAISRIEADAISAITSTDDRLFFVVGSAGGGKSAVLSQAVNALTTNGVTVLGFRLDRLEEFSTTSELGTRLGLPVSPVAALAAEAGDAPSVLVVDQLDAVSLASGRMPQNFDAVVDLVREASAFHGMRVVVACRKFDADNDPRIRQLNARPLTRTIQISDLSDQDIDGAVSAMGLDPSQLTPRQYEILRLPLSLVLLSGVAGEPQALAFDSSSHLFDDFWDLKRRAARGRRAGLRFNETIARVAAAISEQQRLSVSAAVLDEGDLSDDADVLVSEHVLVREGRTIAFFHETFFDYAFSRHWVTRGETLVDFLTGGEQELFRRGQVRQILHHLRETDPPRFAAEVQSLLLSDQVRFHIKDLVAAIVGGLSDPSSAELDVVVAVADSDAVLADRLWRYVRTPTWFARFNNDGVLNGWLAGVNRQQQSRALEVMGLGGRQDPEAVAGLLGTFTANADYPSWLRRVARLIPLHESRDLFDLFLAAVRANVYAGLEEDMWFAAHELATQKPIWAIELLKAHLVERSDALALDAEGRVAALLSREYSGSELIRTAAAAEPEAFCSVLLPYMRDVMDRTRYNHTPPGYTPDKHFSHRYPELDSGRELEDALQGGMTEAVRASAAADPEGFRATLESLAEDELDGSQWLLYQSLLAGGDAYTDFAAELLLQGTDRFFCGYASNSVWIARLLLHQVSRQVDAETHGKLEDAVRDLTFSWENPSRGGWYSFNLLSALDETQLSEQGVRRLGEYRRRFNLDQPPEPEGMVSGFVGPPISTDEASHMTDKNWLQAIAKHAKEASDWGTFKGGARELAQVFEQQTKDDPVRFAQLARRLTAEVNPAYTDALLRGLGDSTVDNDSEEAIFGAIRHIAGLGHEDNDRWLGSAIRPFLKTIPLDIVELIRDRLLASGDPADDSPVFTSSSENIRSKLRNNALNSGRGSLAEALGNLLVFDPDGSRTDVVVPVLTQMAADPILSVRASVAHVTAAAMRHARQEAVAAFWHLLEGPDDLLASNFVQTQLILIGNEDAAAVMGEVDRALQSDKAEIREIGGQLAAFAALEWGQTSQMEDALEGSDAYARAGVGRVCAQRVSATTNTGLASKTLQQLFDDPEDEVRQRAAEVAASLRDHALRPHAEMLHTLVASRAFDAATSQLFITLEHAPDRVDDLALLTAQRFMSVHGGQAGDISTSVAADAHYVVDLVVRGLAQSQTAAQRSHLLDLVDELLRYSVYGIETAIEAAGR
jgi:hypothetical protein